MNQEIVPFGKYKGQPVEVLANDRGYCDWLMSQGDFLDRYIGIKTLIINNFKESDDTPEHNRLQGIFLEEDFCKAFHTASIGMDRALDDLNQFYNNLDQCEAKGIEVLSECQRVEGLVFEDKGVDVKFEIYSAIILKKKGSHLDCWDLANEVYCKHGGRYRIELKPNIGDDYPSILRQMKSNKCNHLFYENYVGQGVSEDNMKMMFALSQIKALNLSEVKVYL